MNHRISKRYPGFLTCRRSFVHLALFVVVLMLFLALVSHIVPRSAYSFDIRLVWDGNTEPDLAGYKVFRRKVGEDYDYDDAAWTGTATTCTIADLVEDTTYFFVARAFDSAGYESEDSNEVSTDETGIDNVLSHVDNAGAQGGCLIGILRSP